MKRLGYTFCPHQGNSSIEDRETLRVENQLSAFSLLPATFYPLILAAFLLLFPQFVEGQCYTLICNQNVEVKLNDNCEGSANPYYMIANNWSCQGPMTMTYYDANNINIGSLLNASHIGQTIKVHVKHNWTGLTCWGTVQVKDKKAPKITTQNVTLNCTEDPGVAALGEPAVTDNCSNQITLSHQDTVIDFGCGFTGFAGYFAPSNWTACLTNTGDGGVDVTGAPNSVLVEGASNSPLNLTPRYVTRFKIVIPTEGYVSFDWSSFGGSSFNTDALYLTINNWCVQLSNDSIQNGSYTTGLLYPGDVLSFEQLSDGNADVVNSIISNFHFHTLAWKVIHRLWTATDEYGNTRTVTQVITLKRAQLSQVVFPSHHDGISAPMLPCGAMADLAQTGVPFVDEDGDLTTTGDQFAVDNGDCFFNLAHTDQVIATCQGSELILRKWIVTDDCSGQLIEHTQIIKLFDVTPPNVVCPPAIVLSTDNISCFGTINLPNVTATDDCSSTVTINPAWQFGSGFGPFGNIAPGTYSVTYHATDACGNSATCSTNVTVEDAVSPTVICDQQTVASLTEDGTAFVYAESVDDGSYDWCCIDNFMIKRASDPDNAYSPTLAIQCSDLDAPVMVRLKVTDCAGNKGYCDVEVIVQDKLDPTITPPADATVDCNTDLSDLAQFGLPVANDNCSYSIALTLQEDFTNCGEGTLTRVWTVTDPGGNEASAQQIIHLVNLNPWNITGSQITWPQNYATSGCGLSLEPFELPAPFNGPTLSGQNGCESVSVNHSDEIFWIAEPSCYKILRTWVITDWCQYQPGVNINGIWEYTQTIEVNDTEPPVFTNAPTNVNATIAGNGCTGSVNLPMPQVSDCSNHVTITALGQLGSGFSFQNVPVGIYQMTYTASDGCGNNSQHPFTVTVADSSPPSAYCTNGMTMSLNSSGQAVITASTFNMNSADNCTAAANLQFSFTQNPATATQTFTCDDLGQQTLQIWVTDQGGNQASCQTYILIQDNQNICDPAGPGVSISGLIQTPGNLPAGQVTVNISGTSMQPETTVPGIGNFLFNNLPPGGDYTVTPQKDLMPLNGVTSFDLVKINDHILGEDEFDYAWQYIAADANNSGTVTAADMVAIQGLILFNYPVFPNNTPSWRFARADYVFPDPTAPFPFPQSLSLNNLTSDYMSAHFTGIKTGDVTGNVNPSQVTVSGTEDRSGEDFIFETEDRMLAPGEEVEVTFHPTSEAAAWQFTLEFDPNKMEVSPQLTPSGSPVYPFGASNSIVFGTTRLSEGALTALSFSKSTTAAFTLRLKAKSALRLSEALQMTSRFTPAAAYTPEEEAMNVRLAFSQQQPIHPFGTTRLFQNQPNPFSTETVIGFSLPESQRAVFTFFDASGRVLHRIAGDYEKGYNSITIHRRQLSATGVIYYRMETNSASEAGRMVVF